MFIKIVIPALFIVALLVLAPLFWIYYANDMHENITISGDSQYSQSWNFMDKINLLIAIVLSNIGYVMALLLIIGIMVGAVVLIGARYVLG